MNNTILMVAYAIFIAAILYFFVWSPAKKEKKNKEELLEKLAVGDYVCTTSGMYGKIIDITSDMVIVEFGGKSCRIPMLKDYIMTVEKPDAITSGVSENAKAGNK